MSKIPKIPEAFDLSRIPERFANTMAQCVYLVEATSFEGLCLWEKYHVDTQWRDYGIGYAPTVGWIDDRPIQVLLSFSLLFGKMVCFWQCVSNLADYNMIEQWLRQAMPHLHADSPDKRDLTCDAQNFHACLGYLPSLTKPVEANGS